MVVEVMIHKYDLKGGVASGSGAVSLEDFYTDASIFITGGTGFLGKCLVEKLLRSFPQIKHIYLLVREKRGVSPEARIKEYFNQSIFSRLRSDDIQCHLKVTGIGGDVTAPSLGMSADDEVDILREVNIIFHVAATVKFTEPIRTAVEINVRGTQNVLELSKQMPKIKSFVHVSTAYSNCLQPDIGEVIYKPPVPYEEIYQWVDTMDDPTLLAKANPILHAWPNTYTFTKCIAETLLDDYRKQNLPVGIFRPAVVVSTYEEPFPGWVDNYSGPTGVVVGAARGYIRCMPGDYRVKPNYVPADMCTNALIATAWDISERFKHREDKIPIYNYVGQENKISYGVLTQQIYTLGLSHPFHDALWYYSLTIYHSNWTYKVAKFILHIVPAFCIDSYYKMTGRRPILLRAYTKIHQMISLLKYFGFNTWNFQTENVENLLKKLTEKEKTLVPFDMKLLDWKIFGKNFLPGVQTYLLKQTAKNLAKARTRHRTLYIIHCFMKTFLPSLFIYFIFRISRMLGRKYCNKILLH